MLKFSLEHEFLLLVPLVSYFLFADSVFDVELYQKFLEIDFLRVFREFDLVFTKPCMMRLPFFHLFDLLLNS